MGIAPTAIAQAGRAKAISNGLRELDRFLSVLIDEVAATLAPVGLDRAAFARERNTPNKLRTIRAALALPSPDHERLRTIGRERDCLFHCAGIVRRGDAVEVFPAAAARRAHADRLTPGTEDLSRLCATYDRIAAELLAACAAHRARFAESEPAKPKHLPVRAELVEAPARTLRQARCKRKFGQVEPDQPRSTPGPAVIRHAGATGR